VLNVKSLTLKGCLYLVLVLVLISIFAFKSQVIPQQAELVPVPQPTPTIVSSTTPDWWAGMTTVEYLANSCFLITSTTGVRLITDPYGTGPLDKWQSLDDRADVVLVSDDDPDDNNVTAIKGEPQIVKGAGLINIDGIQIDGISSFHDNSLGSKRGNNTIFVFTVDGLRFCFLGDLGQALDPETVSEIGKVDFLFIPVGGYDTIDAETATTVIASLNPGITVPMHFKVYNSEVLPLNPVDDFLIGKDNVKKIVFMYTIEPDKFSANRQILVFQPANESGCSH
jgi:L-ascorbate metabolism protein UlaG (beta-lactamase superfamily)